MDNVRVQKEIESVVRLLSEDYKLGRDIDRVISFHQPDTDAIIDITNKLRRIVFPGYFREKAYKIYNHEAKKIIAM